MIGLIRITSLHIFWTNVCCFDVLGNTPSARDLLNSVVKGLESVTEQCFSFRHYLVLLIYAQSAGKIDVLLQVLWFQNTINSCICFKMNIGKAGKVVVL